MNHKQSEWTLSERHCVHLLQILNQILFFIRLDQIIFNFIVITHVQVQSNEMQFNIQPEVQ